MSDSVKIVTAFIAGMALMDWYDYSYHKKNNEPKPYGLFKHEPTNKI